MDKSKKSLESVEILSDFERSDQNIEIKVKKPDKKCL